MRVEERFWNNIQKLQQRKVYDDCTASEKIFFNRNYQLYLKDELLPWKCDAFETVAFWKTKKQHQEICEINVEEKETKNKTRIPFDQMIEKIKAFVHETKRLPTAYNCSDYTMVDWIKRKLSKINTLTEEQVEQLRSIPLLDFNVRRTIINRQLDILDYYNKYHVYPPFCIDRMLYEKVKTQVMIYKYTKNIKQEERDYIKKLPEFDILLRRFGFSFETCLQYYSKYKGNFEGEDVIGSACHTWYIKTKNQYQKGILNEKKKKQFEDMHQTLQLELK